MKDQKPVIIGESGKAQLAQDSIKGCQFEIVNIEKIKEAPYLIIRADCLDFLKHSLRRIRQHNLPAVYLKPVFAMTSSDSQKEYLERIVDKVISANELSDRLPDVENFTQEINERIKLIPRFATKTDNNLAVKILRFLFTRRSGLVPFRSSNSYLGYSYPKIDCFFNAVDKRVDVLLKFLEDHALVADEFVDKVFKCPACLSAFINFRELCPKCNSVNIVPQEMYHHYRCAYVGPAEDFRQGDDLVCPKCRKTLKLLGNDYEKPSIVNLCQDCANRFQSPMIETMCYHCGKINDPDDLIQKTVKKYTLQDLAENVALFGIQSHFQHVFEDNLDLIKFSLFKKFLSLEIKRVKRYKEYVSTCSFFHIKRLEQIYVEMGENGRRLFKELAHLVKEVVSDTDLVSSYNDSTFCILFNNNSSENAKPALEELRKSTIELFKHNVKYDIDIVTSSAEVNGSKDADALLKELAQNGLD